MEHNEQLWEDATVETQVIWLRDRIRHLEERIETLEARERQSDDVRNDIYG